MRGAVAALFAAALAVPSCKKQAPLPAPETTPAAAVVGARPAPQPAHCVELRTRLCAQFGEASEGCAMAKEKTAIFSAEACLKMLSNYDNTAAMALGYVQAKRSLTAREQLTSHGPAPSVGAEGAPLTLVVFADFTDNNCARASGVATTLRNLYASQARLIFRQLPSPKRPDAHLAAQASLAAHAQGKFWRFYEVLFGNTQAQDRAALERYAREAGLDLPKFKKALDQRTYALDVDADIELARRLGIIDVPMFFANGKVVATPYGVTELAGLIGEGAL